MLVFFNALHGTQWYTAQTALGNCLIIEQIQYVTLDYPRLRSLAREDPELFLQQYPAPLIIDEIQYAPELLPYIKIRIDSHTQQNGLYYLTGSQMFYLRKNVSESLAGRVGILSMYSLSRAEIEGRDSIPFRPDTVKTTASKPDNISDIFEKIYRGGMPRMIVDKRSRLCYYRDNNGKEIDLIILENGRLYPIEIKKSSDPGKHALKNFSILESLSEEVGEGAVICMTPMIIPLDKKNRLIPVSYI